MMSTNIRRALPFVAAAVFGAGDNACAEDIGLNPNITQSDFNTVIDELGIITAYNAIGPAETLGITGIDLGLAVTSYDINSSAWDAAVSDGNASSHLTVSQISARKGLVHGFDIGAAYSWDTSGDLSIFGGEVRKSLIEGSTLMPAISVMGHYSLLNGVDDIDLSAYGVDLGISKGFAIFTPYAGIGQVWYDGEETNDSITTISDRSSSQTRSYLGMRIGLLPFMSVTAQAEFAEVDSYSLSLNLGF